MKRNIIYIIILMGTFFSCDNFLELNPETSVSEGTYWKTEKDLTAAVNSVYEVLHSDRTFDEFGMLDVFTDIAASRTVSPFNSMSIGTFDSNHAIILARWQNCYEGIVRANDVLAHVDDMDEVEDDVKNERKGEALFLRAFYYFNLVYFFGDTPLLLNVPTLDDAYIERTPVDDVITQMHLDLDDANNLLTQSPTDVGRATKGAALTLKAKIYMQESQFEKAIPVLQQIMGLGYSLYNDYSKLFLVEGENNAEVIFDVQFASGTGQSQGNKFNTYYGNKSLKAAGWSWFLPTKELIELYETKEDGLADVDPMFDKKDPRMDMTVIRPGATFVDKNDNVCNYPAQVNNYSHAQTGIHCRKFVIEGSSPDADFSGYWDSPQNWIFFRYADVLLMYAEAVNEVDGPVSSVYDAINQVRQRSSVGMPVIEGGKTKEEMREIVHRERGVELALEGWRYFDLKRWGLLKEVNNGFKVINISNGSTVVTRVFNDYHNLWPIPLTEIDRNPNLDQNPGY